MTVYDRAVLVEVVIYHHKPRIEGCACGWAEIGRSWAEHVADVYEASVAARAARPVVDLDAPEPPRRGKAKPPHVSRCATGDGGTCNCPGDYCACGNDWPRGHAGPCRPKETP